jgi:hypothetical protein
MRRFFALNGPLILWHTAFAIAAGTFAFLALGPVASLRTPWPELVGYCRHRAVRCHARVSFTCLALAA